MFAQERQREISALVNENGAVLVKELAPRFGVTEDCIRKDLALLEKKELLSRTYGGAVSQRINPHDFGVSARKVQNPTGKETIACKAAALITEGDTVFLDISTANLALFQELCRLRKTVTLVTNMTELIPLAAAAHLPLISTGGILNATGDGFFGDIPAKFLKKFQFDCGFFGAVGVNTRRKAAYTYTVEDAAVKEAALSSCRQAFLLCETKKFQQDGNVQYAKLSEFEAIILDEAPPKNIAAAAKEQTLSLL